MSTKVNPKSSPVATIYHLSATRYRTLLLMYALVPILLCVFFLMLFDPQLPWSMVSSDFKLYALFIGGGVTGFAALRFIDRIGLRLMIAPEGIAYIGFGYRIFTPWENVEGPGMRTVITEMRGATREVRGLMLSHPAPVIEVKVWARFLLGWSDAEAYFIPLSDFAGYPDELSQHIRHYIPAFSGL
jgi:hypothetical protein